MLEIDILGALLLAVAIYLFRKTIRRLERHAEQMTATLVEMRIALEEMQNYLRTIDGEVAGIHKEGRVVADRVSRSAAGAFVRRPSS